MKEVKVYDPSKRPEGSNADEWFCFLEQRLDNRANGNGMGLQFIAVQIAEALDAVEARYHSAVNGRRDFRELYRKQRKNNITENYNDSLEDVDRHNERTGGGVW